MTTPEPTPPLTDDELERIRALLPPGDTQWSMARLVAEVDRLRAERHANCNAEAWAAAARVARELRTERDALAAKLDAVREIEPTLRRIYATGIASEHEVIDAVDELIGQALQESATTPPAGETHG